MELGILLEWVLLVPGLVSVGLRPHKKSADPFGPDALSYVHFGASEDGFRQLP